MCCFLSAKKRYARKVIRELLGLLLLLAVLRLQICTLVIVVTIIPFFVIFVMGPASFIIYRREYKVKATCSYRQKIAYH